MVSSSDLAGRASSVLAAGGGRVPARLNVQSRWPCRPGLCPCPDQGSVRCISWLLTGWIGTSLLTAGLLCVLSTRFREVKCRCAPLYV